MVEAVLTSASEDVRPGMILLAMRYLYNHSARRTLGKEYYKRPQNILTVMLSP